MWLWLHHKSEVLMVNCIFKNTWFELRKESIEEMSNLIYLCYFIVLQRERFSLYGGSGESAVLTPVSILTPKYIPVD